MTTKWKARLLWGAAIGGLLLPAFVIMFLISPDSPWLLATALAPAACYTVSRFWPTCRHCGAHVFGLHLTPGPMSDECAVCGQLYDQPFVGETELVRRGIERLVSTGRLPPSALVRFDQLARERMIRPS